MKLSIIIPVYNAEKFLDKCIQSILKNDFKNYEIILIDDGSTDNSLKVMQKYQSEIIHVYANSNHGVGYTRNFGLQHAKGEYIIFLDSDDYLDEDYITTLVKNVDGFDVGISGVRFVDLDDQTLGIRKVKNSEWGKYQLPLTAGKIFRTSYILKNSIRYPEYSIGEDLVFNLLSYCYTQNIKLINYVGYNYVQNPQSLTHTVEMNNDDNEQELELLKFLDQNIPIGKIDDRYLSYFYLKTLIHHSLIKRKGMTYNIFFRQINKGIDWIIKRFKRVTFFMKDESLLVNIVVGTVYLCRKNFLLKWIYRL
ncbi:glycosyltransferase family 2 protein [Enterococcus cecorum]|uniref:glycosyltransferase family 2 protein n=4 Tax=Enterococcus cecorum TaxID=44008 RepID=UPI001FAC2257|nr:glycosyltransferase family 2 protein [Enterococcus cecorum]MCJ0537163.1 glycosyltransferase [Enterococcus cecorum]